MNPNAPLGGSSVEQALTASKKRSTKNIDLPETLIGHTPLSWAARLRNASVGMALTYLESLDRIARPVMFTLRNLGVLIAGLLHVMLPLIATWFASHWSERMEQAVWSDSALANLLNFAALWLIMLISWSIIWLALRGAAAKIQHGLHGMATSGEHYLSHGKLSERKGRDSAG